MYITPVYMEGLVTSDVGFLLIVCYFKPQPYVGSSTDSVQVMGKTRFVREAEELFLYTRN